MKDKPGTKKKNKKTKDSRSVDLKSENYKRGKLGQIDKKLESYTHTHIRTCIYIYIYI